MMAEARNHMHSKWRPLQLHKWQRHLRPLMCSKAAMGAL
jgi:hypothetical protein